MKWIGQHIWDLISRFRNTIYLESTPTNSETTILTVEADGKVGSKEDLTVSGSETIHVDNLSTDSTPIDGEALIYRGGTAVWCSPESLQLQIRNDEGAILPVGTPVYSKGEIGGSNRIKVGKADASNAAKMPAIGITTSELDTSGNKDGFARVSGVYNINVSGFSGLQDNDQLYVASGGGLTQTHPAGEGNLVQNMGIVLKTNGTQLQGFKVSSIDRTNATPNLDQNAIFLGDGTNKAVATDAPMIGVVTAATGTAAKAVLGDIDLTSEVTGELPVANFATKDEDDMSSDSATHVPTQQSTKAYVDGKEQYMYLHVTGKVQSATGWGVFSTSNTMDSSNWNKDTNVTGLTIGTSYSPGRQNAAGGVVIPYDCTLVGFYGTGRNNNNNTVFNAGLFVGTPNWGSTGTSSFTLQAVATADKTGGGGNNYKGACKLIDLSRSYSLSAGDSIIPAVYDGAADDIYCSLTIVLKRNVI